MNKNGLLVPYLKYRMILLPFLLLEIIRNPFYKNFVDSSDPIREFFKYIFLKSAILNNITDNLVVIINGQFHLLLKSVILNIFYLAVVFLLIRLADYFRRKIPGQYRSPGCRDLSAVALVSSVLPGDKSFSSCHRVRVDAFDRHCLRLRFHYLLQ